MRGFDKKVQISRSFINQPIEIDFFVFTSMSETTLSTVVLTILQLVVIVFTSFTAVLNTIPQSQGEITSIDDIIKTSKVWTIFVI